MQPDTSLSVGPGDGENVLPPPGERRRLDLHRRRALISSERIDIRPSRMAIVPPLTGFLLGAGCVALIVFGVRSDALPYWMLALLLLLALIAVPLAGITLVYALVGANVIFDRAKQSGTWQQGFLGMGIGTTELVPFGKIEAILVTEKGSPGGSSGSRTEEFAQWEAVVLKRSGKRLTIAGMPVPRRFSEYGLAPVKALADAVGALAGAPVRLELPEPSAVPRAAQSGRAAEPAIPRLRPRGTASPRLKRPPRAEAGREDTPS